MCLWIVPWNCSDNKLPLNDILVLSELSAPDRLSALEVKLGKVDSLISKIQLLKPEINSLKKRDYPYLRAAFKSRTDSTTSARNSKIRKAEGNGNLVAGKESQDRKLKVFKRAQILIIRRQSVQLKDYRKDGIFTLVV